MSNAWNVTRREFVATSTIASLAALAPVLKRRIAAGEHAVPMALMGAGERGLSWIHLAQAAGMDLRAVADPRDPALVDATHGVMAHGLSASFTNSDDEVLANPSIRAVIIATPLAKAVHLAERACRAGKDVYFDHASCGEPALHDLLAAADRAGRVIQVGLPALSNESTKRLIASVADGHLGALKGASLHIGAPMPLTEPLPADVANELAIMLQALGVRTPIDIRSAVTSASSQTSASCWCRFQDGPTLEVSRSVLPGASGITAGLTFVGETSKSSVMIAGESVSERYGEGAHQSHLANLADFVSGRDSALNAELRHAALAMLLLEELQDAIGASAA